MHLVRALHRDKYDRKRKRFTSDTFKNYKGGISVIDSNCVGETDNELCSHIEQYYQKTIERCPFAYWVIDIACLEEHFPGEFEIVEKESTTGDKCHRNIEGISNGRAQSWAKKRCKPPHVFLCLGDNGIQITNEQFEKLHESLDLT